MWDLQLYAAHYLIALNEISRSARASLGSPKIKKRVTLYRLLTYARTRIRDLTQRVAYYLNRGRFRV